MSDHTTIEWTDRTWNPVTGCTKVSAGCDHCYAETIAERFRGGPAFPNGFDVQLRENKLTEPLRWRKPSKVFVNSMSDLFHDDVPTEFIVDVFATMSLAQRHTFQILTKRHGRMRHLLTAEHVPNSRYPELQCSFHDLVLDSVGRRFDPDWADHWQSLEWPLPNVWLGVSTENQQWADIRIPALLDTPAAVRFVSAEPLLGPIDLHTDPLKAGTPFWGGRLDWVIVGGESGRNARPMHPDWARSLRDQCADAGVPFFMKQWGEWVPESVNIHPDRAAAAFLATDGTMRHLVRGIPAEAPRARGNDITIRRVGAKRAGRELDGRTWDEFPEVTP